MHRVTAALIAAFSGSLAVAICATPLVASAYAQDPPAADAEPEPAGDATAEEFVTTKSGLQYRVVQKGDGDTHPRMGDIVTVHYTGKLESGKVFDSSRTKGAPATFTVGGLIPGWNEALQLMAVGTKLDLIIPPELGYGARGAGADIPPNSTLHFEMELLAVKQMPRFVKPTAEAQKSTESGLKYEVLAEGEGALAVETDAVELKFAFWANNGQLLGCSEKQGENLKAGVSSMQVPFLKEAALLMKVGSRYRFEVPGKLGFGERGSRLPDNGVTIWDLELVRIANPLEIPKFEMPAEADLKTTESGLKYKVIAEGAEGGESPKLGEFVTVHYCGWLTDGTKFDSSFERGFETSFQLGRVVKGWNEGLQLMRPGAKYVFVIPPELGYGARGAPPTIGPNATLVFLVQYVRKGK